MSDASASLVVLDSTLDTSFDNDDDDHQQFLRRMDTEDGAQQYLENLCGGDFFEGVDSDDADQVLGFLMGIEDCHTSPGLAVEPLSDHASCKKAPFVIVGGYKCADSVHRDCDKSSQHHIINTKANFIKDDILPSTMLTKDPPSASPDAFKKPDSVDEDIVEVVGWLKSKDPSGAFKQSKDPPGASHDASVGHYSGDDTPEVVPAVVTPYSSEQNISTSFGGSATSCTFPESCPPDTVDRSIRMDPLVNVLEENAVVLGCRNSKNPPGVTSEYKSFKGLKYPKRTAITGAELRQFYEEFLAYLQDQGKCRNATNIDDVAFIKKVEGTSTFTILQGDQRDEAVMKDIRDNNPNRIKAEKSLETFISDTKTKLEGRKSEIDAPIYDIFKSLVASIESQAEKSCGPLDESTEAMLKQMINKHWDWFIKPKVTEKRKCSTEVIDEEVAQVVGENCDHLKKRKAIQERPDGFNAKCSSDVSCVTADAVPWSDSYHETDTDASSGIAQIVKLEQRLEQGGLKLSHTVDYKNQMISICSVQPPLQPLDSESSPQLACSVPVVTPVTELTNEVGSAENVRSAQSTFDNQKPMANASTSRALKTGSAKNAISKFFPQFWKRFFKRVGTK